MYTYAQARRHEGEGLTFNAVLRTLLVVMMVFHGHRFIAQAEVP